ncbi:type II toxin-antitoxin system HicA family toxin, partial [Candidatus Micrarchaeota archaeon]|nr:type II toxin-antitoxin system HicA family toxin [Candidatus Micrarchaeota archaeon]
MKLPVVSGKEVVKALQRDGFTIIRTSGSHTHMVKTKNSTILHVT